MSECIHTNIGVVIEEQQINKDANIDSYFENCECQDCGLMWRTLIRKDLNISVQDYLQHFGKVDHSQNSPHYRVRTKGGIESGCNSFEIEVEYKECPVCVDWSTQKPNNI